MEFLLKSPGSPARLGVLPGAFNPPTVAHLALAEAALQQVDEVVFVLPRTFPHKEFSGAGFVDRVEMLCAAVEGKARFSVAVADRGLFVEIARECRDVYGSEIGIRFLCGRDAAERIVGWDYGSPDAFARMLREFELLVADRGGSYEPPVEFNAAIHRLPLSCDVEEVSATEVRERIARGERWEHLVPAEIRARVRQVYGSLRG